MHSIHAAAQRDERAASFAARVLVRFVRTQSIADADAGLAARLGPDEAERAAKFREGADRKSYVTAHALLRTLLSLVLPGAQAPRTWGFVAGTHGKPMLAPGQAPRDVRFNLSHCRGMVAVALTEGAEVGIDVEALERRDFDDLAIAESNFCAAERARVVRIADAAHRRHAFLATWTAKEALIKALGDGLSMPLTSFCADIDAGRYVRHDAPERGGDWSLARWDVPGHVVALAARAGMRIEARESRWDPSASLFVDGPVIAPIAPGVAA
jgi:4'-phosphopantetheinyl transferase